MCMENNLGVQKRALMLHIVQRPYRAKNLQEFEAKKSIVACCNQLIRYLTQATYFQKILSDLMTQDKYNRTEHDYYP